MNTTKIITTLNEQIRLAQQNKQPYVEIDCSQVGNGETEAKLLSELLNRVLPLDDKNNAATISNNSVVHIPIARAIKCCAHLEIYIPQDIKNSEDLDTWLKNTTILNTIKKEANKYDFFYIKVPQVRDKDLEEHQDTPAQCLTQHNVSP